MSKNLVVLLTAINTEYDAVRRRLTDPTPHLHKHGTRFETGIVRHSSCRVALGLTNVGNESAAVIVERAVSEFDPAAVIFVGVAGALWDNARLGDVVFAKHVYNYQGGTSEDAGLMARPRSWEVSHPIFQLGSELARRGEWADPPPPGEDPPRTHIAPIAAGSVVLNSLTSAHAQWLRSHYNDALAVEMEGAGVAQAAHLSGSQVAVVRGISDRADGTKGSANDRDWQPRAAANAAAFATHLAVNIINDREQIRMTDDDSTRPTYHTQVSPTIHNSTVGNITGFVNNGSSYGSVSPNAASAADLIAELDRFSRLLEQHHAAGDLDDATLTGAQLQLDTARESAQEGTSESKHMVTTALKRLRGLVADVADLAAKIAPLIVMAGGLS
jgi:nucleoside phosphorylase